MIRRHLQHPSRWYAIGLGAIALLTCHALSSLALTILVLAPSSPQWGTGLSLGGLFIVSGTTIGIQSWQLHNKTVRKLATSISDSSSMALLGCYGADQIGGQQAAILGTAVGLIAGGGFGWWNRNSLGRVILNLISSLCAYGAAFILSGWTIAALTSQRWGIAFALGLLSGLYLWITQRVLQWTYHQWQQLPNRKGISS